MTQDEIIKAVQINAYEYAKRNGEDPDTVTLHTQDVFKVFGIVPIGGEIPSNSTLCGLNVAFTDNDAFIGRVSVSKSYKIQTND